MIRFENASVTYPGGVHALKDLTLEIFQQILMEDEFRDTSDVGIVIQAYLPEAERDLAELLINLNPSPTGRIRALFSKQLDGDWQ